MKSLVNLLAPPASHYAGKVAVIIGMAACGSAYADEIPGGKWQPIRPAEQSVSMEPVFVQFDRDQGVVSGNGGCNGFRGEFKLTTSGIEIDNLIQTAMGCLPEVIVDNEIAFVGALRQTKSYLRNGDELALKDAGGKTLVRLRPFVSPQPSELQIKQLKLYPIPAEPRCGQPFRLVTELHTNKPGTVDLRLYGDDNTAEAFGLTTTRVVDGYAKRWARKFLFSQPTVHHYAVFATDRNYPAASATIGADCRKEDGGPGPQRSRKVRDAHPEAPDK